MSSSRIIVIRGQPTIDKDPNATLDYTVDWSNWLADVGDSIAGQLVFFPDGLPAGLTLVESYVAGGAVVAFISGGTLGGTWGATFRITTNSVPPRADERTIFLNIVDR